MKRKRKDGFNFSDHVLPLAGLFPVFGWMTTYRENVQLKLQLEIYEQLIELEREDFLSYLSIKISKEVSGE